MKFVLTAFVGLVLLALRTLFVQVSNFKTEIFKKEISKYQPTCLNHLTTINPGLNTFQRNISPRKKFYLTNFSTCLTV